jgi:hypothetical protein
MALDRIAGQKTGPAATLALLIAIGGVITIFVAGPGWGLLLDGSAAVLGAVGFFMAASPRVGGGVMSIIAVVIAIFGIGLSVMGVIGNAMF